MPRTLIARSESWPLSRPFRISRGVKTAADVVVVELHEAGKSGAGEAVPYARYGETPEQVLAAIEALRPALEAGMTRAALQAALPAGAARNAIDCALWDLEAQLTRRSVADLTGIAAPAEIVTAVTISLDEPQAMAKAAAGVAAAPLLKVKVDAANPLSQLRAVRAAAPTARLMVDPNESWSPALLRQVSPDLAALRVDLIEQPVAAADDAALKQIASPVPLCADESAHTSADLECVAQTYQAVNIKLDKAGGLTEALAMRAQAEAMGLTLMIGCMVCTSLAIAPAFILAGGARFADLDGPWWLARDRDNGIRFRDGRLSAPSLWGIPR